MKPRKDISDAERAQRAAVIKEALTWKGTPFAWEQCVKGAGVDCGRFLAASLNGAGVKQINMSAVPHWNAQWFLHKPEGAPSPFIDQILQLIGPEYQLPAGTIPLPGDVVVAKHGRDWAHSAMVIEWPSAIGADSGHCVVAWEDLHRSPRFGKRALRYFDPFIEAGLPSAAAPKSGAMADTSAEAPEGSVGG